MGELRLRISNFPALCFARLKASTPTKSDSEIISTVIAQSYHRVFISRDFKLTELPNTRIDIKSRNLRIKLDYVAYQKLNRFKHETALSHSKIIRVLIPNFIRIVEANYEKS